MNSSHDACGSQVVSAMALQHLDPVRLLTDDGFHTRMEVLPLQPNLYPTVKSMDS